MSAACFWASPARRSRCTCCRQASTAALMAASSVFQRSSWKVFQDTAMVLPRQNSARRCAEHQAGGEDGLHDCSTIHRKLPLPMALCRGLVGLSLFKPANGREVDVISTLKIILIRREPAVKLANSQKVAPEREQNRRKGGTDEKDAGRDAGRAPGRLSNVGVPAAAAPGQGSADVLHPGTGDSRTGAAYTDLLARSRAALSLISASPPIPPWHSGSDKLETLRASCRAHRPSNARPAKSMMTPSSCTPP